MIYASLRYLLGSFFFLGKEKSSWKGKDKNREEGVIKTGCRLSFWGTFNTHQ